MPTAQNLRQQFDNPNVQALTKPGSGPLHGVIHRFVTGALAVPFVHLWATDRPVDPALLAVLQPVADAVAALTQDQAVAQDWDHLVAIVQTARLALDNETMNAATPDEVIADILFALRTSLLISCTGQIGSTRAITKQLLSNFGGLLRRTPPKLKHFDLATNAFVDNEFPTTLSIAGFKYFARRDDPQTGPPPSYSSAAGGRCEAGHPAHDPRCPPGDHLHGAVRAAHRGPTAWGRH
jgi:hypothetical protein